MGAGRCLHVRANRTCRAFGLRVYSVQLRGPSMNDFDTELDRRLAALADQGLSRQLRRINSPQSPRIEIDGKTLLNFSSNDYLGLANTLELKTAACKAVERYGAGAGAARLICGSLAPHHELEETLAAFKGTEAALTFSTGYAAALGTIGALLGKDDVIVLDKLVHASIVDAARLSGATLRVFDHNDLIDLLVNRARSFVFSTAPVPAAAAAATAGIRFVQSQAGDERRKALWRRVEEISNFKFQISNARSAIVPVIIGGETQAVEAAAA